MGPRTPIELSKASYKSTRRNFSHQSSDLLTVIVIVNQTPASSPFCPPKHLVNFSILYHLLLLMPMNSCWSKQYPKFTMLPFFLLISERVSEGTRVTWNGFSSTFAALFIHERWIAEKTVSRIITIPNIYPRHFQILFHTLFLSQNRKKFVFMTFSVYSSGEQTFESKTAGSSKCSRI